MSDIAKMIAIAKKFGGGSSTPAPVVILPETELTLSDGQYIFTTPWAVEIVAGGVYVVTYNGVEYECEAYDSPEAPGIMTVMGNSEFLASMGIAGGNPDAPFYMICLSNAAGAEDGLYGQLATDGSSASITFSIVQTEGGNADSGSDGGGVFTARVVASASTKEMTLSDCDKTYPEIVAAYNAGKVVRIVASADDNTTEYVGSIVHAIIVNGSPAMFLVSMPYGACTSALVHLLKSDDGTTAKFAYHAGKPA